MAQYVDRLAGRRFDARTCIELLRHDFGMLDEWEWLREMPIHEFVHWERDLRGGIGEGSRTECRKVARLAARLRRMRLKGRFTFPEYLEEWERWRKSEVH